MPARSSRSAAHGTLHHICSRLTSKELCSMHINWKRGLTALAGVLAFAVSALPASAGQFDVKPIRITLSKGATSDTLTIENQASTPLRLQIGGYAWSSDPLGGVRLSPTEDLIVFPTLVTILPMEHRN